MKDEQKTKEQLIGELVELRQRIAELEALVLPLVPGPKDQGDDKYRAADAERLSAEQAGKRVEET